MGQPLALGTIPRSTRGSTRKGGRNRTKEQSTQALADRPARRGGPSAQASRTVRPALADRPACSRGPSTPTPRTVRLCVADCPLKHTEPPEATREKRTVRQGRADRPRHPRTVRYSSSDHPQTGCNKNQKPNRIIRKGAQEHDEHATNPSRADRPPAPRGLSARCGQSRKRSTPKVNSPKSSSDFPNS
jgi:hypothetical protein